MSTSSDAVMVSRTGERGRGRGREDASMEVDVEEKREAVKNYKGFVAGVFSGIAKLTGMFISYSKFRLVFLASCLTASFSWYEWVLMNQRDLN